MAYDSKRNAKALENLSKILKKNPDNFDLWNSKYEIYMDIGCYEGALDCCNEMLRLNPESKNILQEQERLKRRIAIVENIRGKKKNSDIIVKSSAKRLKAPNKNKVKILKEKPRQAQEIVKELIINIPKECSKKYTPNTKYQLRHDADKIRKHIKWHGNESAS